MLSEKRNLENEIDLKLHSHLQILRNILHQLEPTKEYLFKFAPDGYSLLSEEIFFETNDPLLSYLEQGIKLLSVTIEKINLKIDDRWNERNFSEVDKTNFLIFKNILLEYVSSDFNKRKRPPYIREKINNFLDMILTKKIAKEDKKEIVKHSSFILRVICASDLMHAERIVSEILDETSSFCDYRSQMNEDEEPMDFVPIINIVSNAINSQVGYASGKRIELRPRFKIPRNSKIYVQIASMTRAISNIINNAIKYSFELQSEHAWVNIDLEKEDNSFNFVIENWGLAIPQDEIDSGIIFKRGYRGSLSRRTDSYGTGFGLAYAKRIIENHGGKIYVESKPATGRNNLRDYEKPFITKVIVSLPIKDVG